MFKLPIYRNFAQDNLTAFIDDLTSYFFIKNIIDDNKEILIL